MENESNKPGRIVWYVLLLTSLFLFGCSKNQKQTKDMLEVSKKEAIDQLQQVVDQADERLRELQAEVEDATGDARYQLETAIARIKKERQKVIDQIKRVSEASTLTWKDIKSESDDLVREAENTVNGTTNKVRELFTEDEKE